MQPPTKDEKDMQKRRYKPSKGRTLTAVVCSFQRKQGGEWEAGLWIEQAERIIDMDGKLIRNGVYNYALSPYDGCLVLREASHV
ncbi:MAG: hypothetical protein AB7J46_06170 [Candidatus Altimarinota bacterium]